MTPEVRTTYRLVSLGVLPAWASVLLVVCAAAAALLLLRSELRRRRRRRAPSLLYAARILLAVCLGVLVAQPVLFIRREWDRPGVLVLIADRSRSMLRTDSYSDATRLDLASALKCPGAERRETLPGRIRRHLLALEPAAEAWRRQVVAIQNELGEGLPWGAAFEETVARLGKDATASSQELRGLADALGKLEARLAADAAATPKPSRGSAAPDPKLFAPAYLVADQLASLRDALTKSAGTPLDEERVGVLLQAHDDFLASLRAAVSPPALAALQQWCDERFLSELPQATLDALKAISRRTRFEMASALARQVLEGEAPAEPRRTNKDGSAGASPSQVAPPSLGHRVRLFGFEDLTPANALENTDLFAPLDELLRDSLDETVSGVVLFSDGRQNLPERPEVLRRLASRDAPLVLAGVGVGGESPSVAIVDCQAPGLLLGGQEATLAVDLKAAVPKGTPIQVGLSCGAKSLARQSFEADGTGLARVALSFRAPEAGETRSRQRQEAVGSGEETPEPSLLLSVSCSLAPAGGPLPSASCRFAPYILSRPARVLVVAKWARWDIVYLISALRGKPCRVDLALWGAAGEKGIGRGPGFGKIPDQLSHLKRYGLVVLDGEPFPGMTPGDGQLLADHVRQLGGTLLILADGDPWYGQRLAEHFGLRIPDLGLGKPFAGRLSPSTVLGDRQSAIRNPQSEIHLDIPHVGSLPAVSLSMDAARTQGTWDALPAAQRLWAVPDQAIPLLAAGGRTVLSVGFYGRGKVYAFGCGDLFRLREWGNGEGEAPAEPPVDHFLSNLLDDALQPTFRGEEAKLALYPFAPRAGSTAHLLLEGRGTKGEAGRPGASSPLPLAFEPLPGSAGLSHATFRVGAAGRITIEVPGVPSLSATAASAVSREDIDVTLDEPTLRRLAHGQGAAGGAYVPLADLPRAIADLPPRVDHRVAVRQIRLWGFWGLLPALAALMVVDWVLRRRNGLVL